MDNEQNTYEIEYSDFEQKPLTNWVNQPSLRDLKQNIEDADNDNKDYQRKIEKWLDYRNIEGQARVKTKKGRSSVSPKLIRKQAEWRYSSLSDPFTSTEEMFMVSPKSAGDRKRALQNALVLNHQFNVYINKVSFIDDYVRDAVDIGTVIVEVGWETEEEEVTENVPTYEFIPSDNPVIAEQYINLLKIKNTSLDAYNEYMNPGLDQAITYFARTGRLYIAQQTGVELQTRTVETKNNPTVEVCEPANILIDPTCGGDIKKAQFIAKRHKSSLSELQKDGRYHNLKHIYIESADPENDPDFQDSYDISNFKFSDHARKKFVVYTYWGYWDIDGNGLTVPIVASWVNNTLIRMEKNPFPFKKPPFAKAVYMPVRRSVFGEPDAELLIDNQKIVGATTRGAIDLLARSANAQTGTKKDFLDVVNRRKFNNGDNYEFHAQGRPEESVYQHKFPEIPQSVFNMIMMQNTEAESLTGVKAFSSGINSKSLGDSVGGGRDAMDAASKRENGILNRLKEGIIEIGRMFIAMNSEWLSEEEVVRITDEEFITVRRDDLAGTFDLRLDISTAEEKHKRADRLEYMLQTMGNNMDLDLQKILLSDIARLRNMPTTAKKIEEYQPQPDPLAVMKAKLEIELIKKQIFKEEQLGNKHAAEAAAAGYRADKDGSQADLNRAKAGTEIAKERNIHSDSDIKDLDYLRKHGGIDHLEDLEKQDNQAINDINKQVVGNQSVM